MIDVIVKSKSWYNSIKYILELYVVKKYFVVGLCYRK